jgi:1-deoxy-D-xylulose-5-phosphate synthase
MEIGKAELVRKGAGIAILNFGVLLDQALTAAEALGATVVDMRWVKPLDEAMILSLVEQHDLLITLEENAVAGGAGQRRRRVPRQRRRYLPSAPYRHSRRLYRTCRAR